MSVTLSRHRAAFGITASLFALSCASIAMPAIAQTVLPDSQTPATTPETLAEPDIATDIVVTGSRILRPELSFPNPIEVITAKNIEESGDTNLIDALLDSPALVGSLSSERNSGSNAGFQSVGLNLLDLRNLGTARTLVLVNGRRHVNAFPGENSVDVNTIPVDLIESVDILTGGVSAIYGADGVSGVVNFKLLRNFEGLKARGQIGISEQGDAGNKFGSIVAGKNFADGRGNIALAYEYSSSDRFSQRQRSYTGDPARRYELLRDPQDFPDDPNVADRRLFNYVGWADSAPNGAVDVDLDGIPDFEGGGRIYDGGQFLSGSGGRAINGSSNTPTAGYFGDFAPQLERHNVNLLTSFEISPAIRFFAEAKYVKTRALTESQPSFDFGTYLTPDNFYLNRQFGALAPDGALVNRDNFDFGISRQKADRETIRSVVGFDGELSSGEGSGNFRYELSYVYGRASSVVTDENTRVTDRYFAAIDAVRDPVTGNATCRINLPGESIIDSNNYAGVQVIGGVPVTGAPLSFSPGQCQPLNILGSGVSSQAAIDWVYVDSITRARSEQHVVSGSISGDLSFLFSLPGGPIGFAVGGEYRKESTRSTPSEFQAAGFFDGGSAIISSGGGYDVKEVFGEINVPLLKDLPFAKNLSFGGAARFSDYSTIGSTFTWKLDGSYSPVSDITFRGSYSQAVRAPNITELFSPLQGTFQFLDDPCDPVNLPEGTQYREANCRAALTAAGLTPAQIANFSPSTDAEQSTSQPGLTGGNPNLTEETAKTWTAGLVLRPSFIPGLSITADWYDINIKNAINTPDVNELFKLCVDQPSLDNVFCNNFSRASGTGFINTFIVQAQNVAQFTTAGLEVSIGYRFKPAIDIGTFNFRLSGNYLDDLTFYATAGGVPEQQRNRMYQPRYVGNLDLGWSRGPISINYGLGWQGKTQRFTDQQLRGNPDISDSKYFLYKERWEHDIRFAINTNDRFTFYGGVNNFTNQQPDVAALAGYPVSAVGRYFYFGAKISLDRLF
ncbi:iron complex outermembrane receptor protein [Sphingomonas sp. UYAg733]